MIEHLTAKDARNISDKARKEVSTNLALAYTKINEAAREGETEIYIKNYLSDHVLKALEDRKFKVKRITQYNDTSYKISW